MGHSNHPQHAEAAKRAARQSCPGASQGPGVGGGCLPEAGGILVLNCILVKMGTGPSNLEEFKVFAG